MILTVIPEISCHTLPHLQGVVGFICFPEESEKGKPDHEGGELLILSYEKWKAFLLLRCQLTLYLKRAPTQIGQRRTNLTDVTYLESGLIAKLVIISVLHKSANSPCEGGRGELLEVAEHHKASRGDMGVGYDAAILIHHVFPLSFCRSLVAEWGKGIEVAYYSQFLAIF